MSSPTVPAAAGSPANSPQPAPITPEPQASPRGGLAALLTPVAPVRTPAAAQTDDENLTGNEADGDDEENVTGSSSSYKSDDGNTDDGSSSNGRQNSIPRAFMLAWAERWKDGSKARLKSLDVQKAKAQARQIKTTKTVNAAGMGGLLGGGRGGQNSPSGKGADKGSTKKSPAAPKQSPAGRGSGGTNGAGGRGSSSGPKGPASSQRRDTSKGNGGKDGSGKGRSGGSGGAGNSGSGKGAGGGGPKKTNNRGTSDKGLNKPRTKNNAASDVNKTPKTTKTPGGQTGDRPWRKNQTPNSKTNKGSGGSATPKDLKRTKGPDAPSRKQPADLSKDKTPKTNTKASTDKAGRDEKPKRPWHRTPESPKNTKGPEDLNTPKLPGKPDLKKTDPPKPDAAKGPVKQPRKLIDLVKRPKRDPKAADGDSKADSKPQPKQAPKKPQTPVGTLRRTQKARETGYRHGITAGEAAAKAHAYRDGMKDGYQSRIDNGRREAGQMDAIHADRKKNREEQPVNATSADQAPQATTIPAKSNGKTIQLGDGANRSSISRGEVRNLKQYQDRLTGKTDIMQRIAEGAIGLQARAEEHATNATRILEEAKQVKGGDKLAGKLAALEDKAKVQAARAQEIHKRAARATDACKALHANADTRYGAMYKAVADSDENAPAEMKFYAEGTTR